MKEILLTAFGAFSLLQASAADEPPTTVIGGVTFTYTISGDYVSLIGAANPTEATELTITSPVEIDGTSYPVYFNKGVFASAGNITSLTLKGAFHNDDKGSPFSGSSGNSALANAKFKTIDLSGMTGDVALCEYMFSGCTSATTITLPDGVSEIPYSAFANCRALTTINGDTSKWTKIGPNAFQQCRALKVSLNLPGVTEIGKSAFYGAGITEVSFGALTAMPAEAFGACSNLTSVSLPETLTSIGDKAFSSASGRFHINLPASLETLGTQVFYQSSIESVTFAENGKLTSIPAQTFGGCSRLKELIFPDYVESIAADAIAGSQFYKSGLTKIAFPANEKFTAIPANFCKYCPKVAEVVIPANVTSIGDYAFMSNAVVQANGTVVPPSSRNSSKSECCAITSLSIPGTVKTIGVGAFAYNPLTSLELGYGVESIGKWAFALDTEGFETLSIPATVMTIADAAFYTYSSASKLKQILLYADPEHDGTGKTFGSMTFMGTNVTDVYTANAVPPTTEEYTFGFPSVGSSIYATANLHVLKGTKDAYLDENNAGTVGWRAFKKGIQDATLTGIGDVTSDAGDNGTVEIYSLQGVRVYAGSEADAPALKGLYVVRKNNTAHKVVY